MFGFVLNVLSLSLCLTAHAKLLPRRPTAKVLNAQIPLDRSSSWTVIIVRNTVIEVYIAWFSFNQRLSPVLYWSSSSFWASSCAVCYVSSIPDLMLCFSFRVLLPILIGILYSSIAILICVFSGSLIMCPNNHRV